MHELRIARRFGIGILALALGLVACGTAAAPPDAMVTSPPIDGGGGFVAPPGGGGKLVVPKPGQLDVRAIPAEGLSATVDGSTIVVTATWTSGVEPCSVLDSIVVDRGEGVFSITLREGHGPEEIACIAIAEQHRTVFGIPDVEPGTWTIRDAMGLAPDIQVVVG